MGQPKQLLPWRGVPLVRYVVEQTSTVIDRVVVVTGAYARQVEEALSGLRVSVIHNNCYREGLGTSLRAGTEYVVAQLPDTTHLLVLLADQPAADPTYLRQCLEAAATHPTQLIATAYPDGRAGVPAVYPYAYFPQLLQLGGDAGGGQLLKEGGAAVHLLHPQREMYDIDTPEDYRRYHEGN